jgi:hypothetical protein
VHPGGLYKPLLLSAVGKEAPVVGVLGAPDHLVLETIGSFIRDNEELFGLACDGGWVQFLDRCQYMDNTPTSLSKMKGSFLEAVPTLWRALKETLSHWSDLRDMDRQSASLILSCRFKYVLDTGNFREFDEL